ncbi:hypothetical protein F4W70_28490 [Pseudomonas cannabina]|nr:hypothetical protein F4W70_28490 [Pseudomonas cannabina]SDR54546.1 hypothetical protein SAMN05216597_5708 [Pseudomonas cannabina]
MKIKPFAVVGDVVRKAHVHLITKTDEYSQHPVQRRIMLASAGITMGTMFVAQAHAAGFADMGNTAAEQGDSLKESFGKLFAVLGFGGAGWGGMNMWKKTQQGENSRITGTQIWGPLLGGAALGATGFMMTTAGETVGIAAGQQGVVPG